jgi:hypothetical protein
MSASFIRRSKADFLSPVKGVLECANERFHTFAVGVSVITNKKYTAFGGI